MSNKNISYTTHSVTSKDGTIIGYRQMGSGPGIILLHGGINASQHLMKMGTILSNEFTVYIPDRRGRGLSGPMGDNYSIEREDEDMDALLKKTDAHYVFGTADGALFALHSSINNPNIHMVAVYEPLFYLGQPELDLLESTMQRFAQEVTEDKVADAMVTGIKGAKSPKAIYWLPRFLLVAFSKIALSLDARSVKGDDVSLRNLIPTMPSEIKLVRNTEGTIEDYKDVTAEVFLMMGSKSRDAFKDTLDALEKVLPHSYRIELEGLDHGSAQDYGKPEIIAQELRRFFTTH
jgi:pimeloyl-ACP methyl ester carboxylesterase